MIKLLITFFIVIVFPFSSSAQDNSPFQLSNETFQLKWMEPKVLIKEVGKHEKLEFGLRFRKDIELEIKKFIATDKDGINPFNPEDISVEFIFISPSEKKKVSYGFYYQAYTRSGEKWVENQLNYNWRIRFSPDEIGEWKFTIKIGIRDKTLYSMGTTFKCIPSKSKGTICRNYNGDNSDRYLYLSETKQPFFTIGHNIAHSAYYKLTPQKAEQHKKWLTELAENGGNFFRLELGAPSGLPDWNDYKNYTSKMPQMFEFDGLIEHAQKLELYFILFRHHTEVMTGESWDVSKWDNNPYKVGFDLKNREEYFTNEQVIKWQKNSLRYIFSRWGYSTSFAFYEYQELDNWLSELQKETGYDDKKAITLFKNWYLQQKEYITTELGYNNKLFINTYATTPDIEYNLKYDGMFANSDVIGFHNYGQKKDMNYKERYDKAIDLWKVWKKPLFVEELGVNAGTGNNFLPFYKCSNVDFHNAIWSTSFMGVVGTGMHWWWDRGVHDFGFYKEYNALASFFRNEKMNTNKYTPQKWHSKISIKRALVENYALVNEDGDYVIGWVHNASNYWRNVGSSCFDELKNEGEFKTPYKLEDGNVIGGPEKEKTDFTQKPDAYTKEGIQNVANQTFKIKKLKSSNLFGKKQWYEMNYYSTISGDKVFSKLYKTTIWGKLKPTYPTIDEPDFSYKLKYLGEDKKEPK